jgi:hypothetical protein
MIFEHVASIASAQCGPRTRFVYKGAAYPASLLVAYGSAYMLGSVCRWEWHFCQQCVTACAQCSHAQQQDSSNDLQHAGRGGDKDVAASKSAVLHISSTLSLSAWTVELVHSLAAFAT